MQKYFAAVIGIGMIVIAGVIAIKTGFLSGGLCPSVIADNPFQFSLKGKAGGNDRQEVFKQVIKDADEHCKSLSIVPLGSCARGCTDAPKQDIQPIYTPNGDPECTLDKDADRWTCTTFGQCAATKKCMK